MRANFALQILRVRVSGVGVHEPTRMPPYMQKAKQLYSTKIPYKDSPTPLQLQRCSVTSQKGGNTKRNRPQVYIRFPYRCLQGESTVGILSYLLARAQSVTIKLTRYSPTIPCTCYTYCSERRGGSPHPLRRRTGCAPSRPWRSLRRRRHTCGRPHRHLASSPSFCTLPVSAVPRRAATLRRGGSS